MDFTFNEEQQMFYKAAHDWCQAHIAPRGEEIDEGHQLPADLLRDMGKQGFLGITYDPAYGGQGADVTTAAIGGGAIASADLSGASVVLYLVEAAWGGMISKYGTDQLKEEVIPAVCRGEAIAGVATTETHGGSDIANIKTRAEKQGTEWVLNGEKVYISATEEAKALGGGHVTLAVTKPGKGSKGQSLFFVPAEKWAHKQQFHNMGRTGISTGGFMMDDCRLPEHHLVGKEGRGFYYAMEAFNDARAIIGVACAEAAGKALELGIEHLKERELFGYPLAKRQGLQWQAADLWSRIECAKLIGYKAAWSLDRYYEGKLSLSEANLAVAHAKLYCPQTALDTMDAVMNWFGALAYTKEFPLQRAFRGIKSYTIGAEGAKNIMKIIIAREIIGKEFLTR